MPANIVVWCHTHVAYHSRARLALTREMQNRARRMFLVGLSAGELEQDIKPAKHLDKFGRFKECGSQLIVKLQNE